MLNFLTGERICIFLAVYTQHLVQSLAQNRCSTSGDWLMNTACGFVYVGSTVVAGTRLASWEIRLGHARSCVFLKESILVRVF